MVTIYVENKEINFYVRDSMKISKIYLNSDVVGRFNIHNCSYEK